MFGSKSIFKLKLAVLFAMIFSHGNNAQTVTGFLSILQSASALGCGCTGCNDAAFMAAQTYPDPNGGCGTTEPGASSGGCAALSKTFIIVIPSGCSVAVTGCMRDRTGCAGATHGPGMDGGDSFSIVGSGGTTNGTTGTMTGASNAQVCATMNQVGGQVAFNLTANRVAELLTYTITYSGAGCTPGPLPVEFVDFSVEKTEGELNLFWSTATEHNSLNFEIEYAYDAIHFNKIATVAAAGESHGLIRYSKMIPDTFKNEVLYLRLKQNDHDGTFSYSPMISVVSHMIRNFKIQPNPTESGEVVIVLNDKIELPVQMEILDFTGRKLSGSDLEQSVNNVSLKGFDKGIYFIRITANGKMITNKIISR